MLRNILIVLESAVMAEKVENRRGYGEEVIGVWKNGYSVGETGNWH